jgi:hypothetical protein
MSGAEKWWLGVLGGIVAGALILPAAASADVLYDQTDHATPPTANFSDPNFSPSNDYGTSFDRTADDFTVPAGQEWSLNEVDVTGAYGGGTPGSQVNVYVARDSAGIPGPLVIDEQAITATGGPSYTIPLVSVPPLTPGTYWLTVQQDNVFSAYWSWGTRSVQTGDAARWITTGSTPNCSSLAWNLRTACFPGTSADQTFQLKGASQDIQDPETTITSSPKKLKTKKRKVDVRFAFTSSEAGSSFSCSLDGAAAKACTSPFEVRVGEGRHNFNVVATDASGNVDATPAIASFTVKRKHRHKH